MLCCFCFYWTTIIYFNPTYDLINSVDYSSLGVVHKRRICRSRDIDLGYGLRVINGMLDPSSFCNVKKGESLFKDAHDYFYCISRNVENYSDIAKRYGDMVFLTDNEIYSAIRTFCISEYKVHMYPSMF